MLYVPFPTFAAPITSSLLHPLPIPKVKTLVPSFGAQIVLTRSQTSTVLDTLPSVKMKILFFKGFSSSFYDFEENIDATLPTKF